MFSINAAGFLIPILIWGIGLYILYIIIVKAVKRGINESVIGQERQTTHTEKYIPKTDLDDE